MSMLVLWAVDFIKLVDTLIELGQSETDLIHVGAQCQIFVRLDL